MEEPEANPPEEPALVPEKEHFPGSHPLSLEALVKRAHEGLGHPGRERFLRILSNSKASQRVLDIAQKMKCSVCEKFKLPKPSRAAAPPREIGLNEIVGVDSFQVREFENLAEADGTELLPSALETPEQRGFVERQGQLFKDMFYKTMKQIQCSDWPSWYQTLDLVCFTKNRLLSRGESDVAVQSLASIGDTTVAKAMEIRKAAACAFHEIDCQQAVGAAATHGPRPFYAYETGQAVYFWRRGTDAARKPAIYFWHGPARAVATQLPHTVWLSYNHHLVKAAPEKLRPASEEEFFSLSGWLEGISVAKKQFEADKIKGLIDLTKETEGPAPVEDQDYWRQSGDFWIRVHVEPRKELFEPKNSDPDLPFLTEQIKPWRKTKMIWKAAMKRSTGTSTTGGPKIIYVFDFSSDWEAIPVTKKSQLELLDLYYTELANKSAQRQKKGKESTFRDFMGKDAERLQRAIHKEFNNNLATGAYELLDPATSALIRKTAPEKIMKSRYVLTKKPIEDFAVEDAISADEVLDASEPDQPCKAKCRHVMQGYSESALLDLETSTPQVHRDSVIFAAQLMASMGWIPGFADFTQAFHSGDAIDRKTALLQQSFPRPLVKDIIAANQLAKEALDFKDLGIRVMPIPLSRLRAGVVTDASWGNSKEFGTYLEQDSEDWWEETEESWIRHHVHERRTAFHPAACPDGPDLHDLHSHRTTDMLIGSRHSTVRDEWTTSDSLRPLASQSWPGVTTFYKQAKGDVLDAKEIHAGYEQLKKLYRQGGEIVIFYDQALPESQSLQDVSIPSWKSYRLKRQTVNTLSSETQALVRGLGSVHWYRILILEARGLQLSAREWHREVSDSPSYASRTPSRSMML
eukprot:s1179_g22.t1